MKPCHAPELVWCERCGRNFFEDLHHKARCPFCRILLTPWVKR